MGRHAGFTLIETVIAAGLLIWGLVAVAHLVAYSVAARTRVAIADSAFVLAQNKVSELRAMPFARLTAGGGGAPVDLSPGFFDCNAAPDPGQTPPATDPIPGEPFLRTWQVEGATLKTVTVAVYRVPRCPPASEPGTPDPVALARATTLVAPRF